MLDLSSCAMMKIDIAAEGEWRERDYIKVRAGEQAGGGASAT